MLLYVNVLNLLGPKPQPQWQATAGRGRAIEHLDRKNGHKTSHQNFQNLAAISSARTSDIDVPNVFCLPENDEFAGYWDRAQDCLYKIRHCMNIKGVVRQLALFEPPIDPRQLIRALAGGQSLESIAGLTAPTVPHYRFSISLQQARNLTATVIQLGSALASAFEKKDAEDLNLLRSTQEQAILNLMRLIKVKQIDDGDIGTA